VSDAGTQQLKPYGPVIPHPGLARSLLDDDHAKLLAATYQPSWRSGESGRLADDAGHLLRDEFAQSIVEELRPDQLSARIDLASPGQGARNVAVLFTTTAPETTKKLIKDLTDIAGKHHEIVSTALATLLQPDRSRANACPPLVTPLRANPAQRAVLRSAMTQRLTVATGPPGTGKSQLVVNAVATAIAAGQAVLVASTNNQAVDEVWGRCEELVPGSLIRTGSKERTAEKEAAGFRTLLGPRPADPTLETSEAEHRAALRRLADAERRLGRVAVQEADLHRTGRNRVAAEEGVGRSADELSELLGPGWGRRARALAGARFFGGWRRKRFLSGVGLPSTANGTVGTCTDMADLADLDEHWKKRRRSAAAIQSDCDLTQVVYDADDAVERASTELLRNCVHAAAGAGKSAIQALRGDWNEFRGALPYVRGWAVTCQSARRRIPPDPALFNLVIIDEASQCSIPAVVPLLFRAERALIIGDVMQLPHISTLPAQLDAELRRTHNLTSEWLDEHQMSVRRHSSFRAAQRAAGGSLLLDEHYRCHPDIAAVSNALFYGGGLTVLTDIRGRPAVDLPAVSWESVRGRAVRGSAGKSWYNTAEIDRVVACVEHLLAHLPPEGTLGVITPYRRQVEELEQHLGDRMRDHRDRIRIGTVHAFQGGERDAIVLSLVATRHMPTTSIDWMDSHQLWNVAITRARSHLIVVGDDELWEDRGGVGAELWRAAHLAAPFATTRTDTDLVDRLYEALSRIPASPFELGVSVRGHRADARITTDDGPVPVVLDPGAPAGQDQAGHLRQMLRRRELLSEPAGRAAVRLPAWILYDAEGSIAGRVHPSEDISILGSSSP